MALTYSNFLSFPIQIVGVNSDYNAKITAIENFVVSDLAYSGTASDLTAILPYFVFWFFCNDTTTTVVESGENGQVKEFSYPETIKQETAWNIGVDKLRTVFGITDDGLAELVSGSLSDKIHALVLASDKTVNEKYLSKRSRL